MGISVALTEPDGTVLQRRRATFGVSLQAAKVCLPAAYVWADLGARCAVLLDTLGITVTA